MKEKNPAEQAIRHALQQGRLKKEILTSLSQKYDTGDLLFYLNNIPEEQQRRHYLWLNRLLCLCLFLITIKKLYDLAMLQLLAIQTGHFSPILLLDLIVPMINFYILSKLIRFHRQGYQFMAILGILALIRPENRIMPDMPIYLLIIILSFHLLFRLFPKNNILKP